MKTKGGILLIFSLVVTFVALGILFLLSSTSIANLRAVSTDYTGSQLVNNIKKGIAFINNNALPEFGDDNLVTIETIEAGNIVIKAFIFAFSVSLLFLITFIFTLVPLAKTTRIKPGYLFRSSTTRDMSNTPSKFLIWVIGAFLCLALISILNNNDQRLTFFFVIGVAVLFCMFLLGSYVTKFLCFKLTHIQLSFFRLVLSNIIRPGNLTTGIILSLGCGLTLLLTVALVEENLSRRLSSDIPKIAPAYFFIDIQPHQNDAFMQQVNTSPGVTKVEKTPMTRGRVAVSYTHLTLPTNREV